MTAAPTALTVLIVDDEPIARRRMSRLVRGVAGVVVVGEAGDVDTAVEKVAQLRPDIMLLDILIPGGDGFAVLERLGSSAPQIIFVTAFGQHALRAFDKAAVDYITKPVDPARLERALNRAAEMISARDSAVQIDQLSTALRSLRETLEGAPEALPVIWVKDRHGLRRIALRDIIHIRAERDYVRLHMRNGSECLHAQSMAALESRLSAHGFVRVHRSLMVRIDAVIAIQRQRGAMALKLADQTIVPTGRSYHLAVRAAFLNEE